MTAPIHATQSATLQAVWRKAYRDGTLTLPAFGSASEAQRVKFALYAAVRAVKKGLVDDPELYAAATMCSLAVKGEVITFTRVDKLDYMQILNAVVGDSVGEVVKSCGVSPEPLTAPPEIESQRALLAKLTTPEPAGNVDTSPATPYYTRP